MSISIFLEIIGRHFNSLKHYFADRIALAASNVATAMADASVPTQTISMANWKWETIYIL